MRTWPPFQEANEASGSAIVTTAQLCVHNDSGIALLFVVALENGERRLRVMPGGQALCLSAPKPDTKGTVAVFENEEALEGCSRLAKAGKPERLISYASFDNCAWVQ